MSIRNHTICQLLPVSNIEWRMTVFLWACWQLSVIKEGHVCINMTEILSWKQIRLKWELSESLSAGVFICVCLASVQSDGFLKDNNNAAQRLLDGVKYISQSVSELSVKPAKAVTSWLTDQIAPAYWQPNSLILVCNSKAGFEKKNYSIVERKRLRKLYGFIATVWHCVRCRNAINVRKSSSPTTPSTTAAPAGRASATPAPPKPGPSRREAGASHLCGSATPVSTTGKSQPVKYHPHQF